MRISNKTVVQSLLFLLKERGIQNVVYSPGSRNAPFAIGLDGDAFFHVHIKVDERSAAFFALGMAQQLHQPVALICTSGTAPLNYAPAVAEAFYQEIPLVVITADRPAESINQGEGQCINQIGIYNNYIKAQCNTLEEAIADDHVINNHQIIAKTLDQAQRFPRGPVHINVPFKEPLYLEDLELNANTQVLTNAVKNTHKPQYPIIDTKQNYLVLMGQNHETNSVIAQRVSELARLKNVLVLTETHSNAHALGGIDCIDRWIMSLTPAQEEALNWDVVISLGHNVVSRKIKALIKTKAKCHWSIQWQFEPINTFRLNPLVIQSSILDFLNEWLRQWAWKSDGNVVIEDNQGVQKSLDEYFNGRSNSDLKLFYLLSQTWPKNACIQMGNSSVVRYIQLFEQRRDLLFFGNRGVSGIDGSTSTAVGAAMVNKNPLILVTGDLSFLYDANGLWQSNWPSHLKVIVVDNGGGGIFKIIDGAKKEKALDDFFVTPHTRDLSSWVKGWGMEVMEMMNPTKDGLEDFFSHPTCNFLIVKTTAEINPIELDLFFEYFRKQNERVENN